MCRFTHTNLRCEKHTATAAKSASAFVPQKNCLHQCYLKHKTWPAPGEIPHIRLIDASTHPKQKYTKEMQEPSMESQPFVQHIMNCCLLVFTKAYASISCLSVRCLWAKLLSSVNFTSKSTLIMQKRHKKEYGPKKYGVKKYGTSNVRSKSLRKNLGAGWSAHRCAAQSQQNSHRPPQSSPHLVGFSNHGFFWFSGHLFVLFVLFSSSIFDVRFRMIFPPLKGTTLCGQSVASASAAWRRQKELGKAWRILKPLKKFWKWEWK